MKPYLGGTRVVHPIGRSKNLHPYLSLGGDDRNFGRVGGWGESIAGGWPKAEQDTDSIMTEQENAENHQRKQKVPTQGEKTEWGQNWKNWCAYMG